MELEMQSGELARTKNRVARGLLLDSMLNGLLEEMSSPEKCYRKDGV